MLLEAACLFLLANADASESSELRPFYVTGHMANSLEIVDTFVGQGVNAIEADLTFASDGTAEKFYHGDICDCARDCDRSADVGTYLSYLRDAVNEGGKFAGKLQLLYVDSKTESLSSDTKYQAGINLANSLINLLWNNGTIPSEYTLNVVITVSSMDDKDVLAGALDTFKQAASSPLFLEHAGFGISGCENLNVVADGYEELGISQHRWQGDGASNCLIEIYWEACTKDATSRRTAANTTHGYVDKVYVWTVDTPIDMRRFLRLDIDSMLTNDPPTLLSVLQEDEFLKMYRPATSQDSPWKRSV